MSTRAEQLASDIADAILTGVFAPGARLDEQGLADRYGVSRTPVREALRLLGHTGLVEIRPRRGATVADLTAERVDEMFVAMGEIEATCARLCALGMTPIDRRRLEALHERMGPMVKKRNEAEYADANTAFHSAIYAGTHNTLLIDIATALRRRLSPFRRAQFRAPGRLARSHAEHAIVIAAILRGDAAEAHAAMLRHVNLVEDAYEQVSAGAARRPRRVAK
ncbi:MAG: gntR [Hyphomicrobiales bacterium]|nr:gntR [Hyphomicrobiales bacterium]